MDFLGTGSLGYGKLLLFQLKSQPDCSSRFQALSPSFSALRVTLQLSYESDSVDVPEPQYIKLPLVTFHLFT